MTLLVISPDFASHAVPLITIARSWAERGDEVVVATGSAVAPMVAREGLGLTRLVLGSGSNPGISRPEDQARGEDDRLRAFFRATRDGMVATLRFQAEARAQDLLWNATEVARRTIAVVDAVRPDAILVDHLAFGATVGLRAMRIPYVDIVLGHPRQLPVAGEVYGQPGAWPVAIDPPPRDLSGLERLNRTVAADFTAAYNEALRTIADDADPVDDAFAAHGGLVLYNHPEALHDPGRAARLPANHAFLGAAVRREPPSGPIRRWLDGGDRRPLIVVSLGTFLSARDDVLARIVDALRALDVRVALATGSTDVTRLGPLPGDWLVDAHIPQVALLERADALVTHGGNNSVTESLAAGVPMLVLPFSTDQFDEAAAVEAHGLGVALDPNRAGPAEIATGIDRILTRRDAALDDLRVALAARPGAGVARDAVDAWSRSPQPALP